jgi:hypothetical protein
MSARPTSDQNHLIFNVGSKHWAEYEQEFSARFCPGQPNLVSRVPLSEMEQPPLVNLRERSLVYLGFILIYLSPNESLN